MYNLSTLAFVLLYQVIEAFDLSFDNISLDETQEVLNNFADT